jgi:glycosyltransferase involved in cell wall biosynthesis
MNILITTGIFPPESGGPATYAAELARRLSNAGHTVTVITLSENGSFSADGGYDFDIVQVTKQGKALNYLRFFWQTLKAVRNADVVYTLSFFSLGFITSVCARLFTVPYVVRVGGGYLWEHFYLKNDKPPMPLRDFYKQNLHEQYLVGKRVLQSTLGNADTVVFNSEVQAHIYAQAYNLKARTNVAVVSNPMPQPDTNSFDQQPQPDKEIIFAGRFVPMKNIDSLVRAFAQTKLDDYRLTLIGDGPTHDQIVALVDTLGITEQTECIDNLPQSELFARIANARLVILPSWTDICPNFVFECLALNIPFVLTEENYLPFRDSIPNTIDPRSVDDIASTVEKLATDDRAYKHHKAQLAKIAFSQTWEDIVDFHISLFKKIVV